MRAKLVGAVTLCVAAFLAAGQAIAQSEADFVKAFAGQWQIVDSRFTTDAGLCRVTLNQGKVDGRYQVQTSGCSGEAGLVTSWSLKDGQMGLSDAGNVELARLGGNQKRMSGNTAAGTPMILERSGVAGPADILQAAQRQYGCFFAGFTDKCAPDEQLGKPQGETPSLNVLVNLNVRSEARDDAGVVGVVPANTCIAADLCLTATDGVWCRAKFDERTGWLRKLALRQNRWPVVTFTNGCTPPGK